MMINNFRLQNFRNYEDETVKLMPGINILMGNNGQGKTNVIEAIYYLLTGKSYRVQREQELMRWEQNEFHLYGDFSIACLLYTSDAADEEDSVDLGGRRIIKKK